MGKEWVVVFCCVICFGCGDEPADLVDGGSPGDADATTSPGDSDASNPGGPDASTPLPGGRFTVLSYNLLHGFPDFVELDERTAIVVDYINDVQPDVVLVQEIGQTPTVMNRLDVLAEATGYDSVFEQASGFEFVFIEGPGILSKWPILSSDAVMLPHPGKGGFEIRKTVGAVLDTPLGHISAFSAHMTTQNDETIQADQALTAYEFVMGSAGELPVFFGGDLNAEPETLAMQFLVGDADHDGTTGTLVDSWVVANPDDIGFTSPSHAPDHRIDYVLLEQGTAGETVIESCELVLDEPVGGRLASDHIGVLCVFKLP